jgi:hypothetical protein
MTRIGGSGVTFVLLATLTLPSTASAGFFDQLFGGGTRSGTFFGFPTYNGEEDRQIRQHIRPRKIVDEKPILQTPTDLMHDPTLRAGDAVMTSSGIKIFTGGREPTHDAEDFTPLRTARYVTPNEKSELGQLDALHTGIVVPKPSNSVMTGRSAAITNPVSNGPIVTGVMIKDRNGKEIRFVGP